MHPSTSIVGLGAGVTLFATISDETIFKPVNALRRNAAALAKYKRCLSRKTKSSHNKSILDQGWGEFRRQLQYKQAWRGGDVLAIHPRNTSRMCPACNHISAESRKTQSKFECVECEYAENADLSAAINILRTCPARLPNERCSHVVSKRNSPKSSIPFRG